MIIIGHRLISTVEWDGLAIRAVMPTAQLAFKLTIRVGGVNVAAPTDELGPQDYFVLPRSKCEHDCWLHCRELWQCNSECQCTREPSTQRCTTDCRCRAESREMWIDGVADQKGEHRLVRQFVTLPDELSG